MEIISRPILFLAAYNLIFFWKFYSNPWRMCTSEIASTFFPFWHYSAGRIIFKDHLYYRYPACIPFLSSFYWWNIFSGWISRRWSLSLDNAFKIYAMGILLHFLLGSILAFFSLSSYGLLAALFGALSLTYSAYFIKPFTPCAIYSMAWMPGILLGGWKGACCLGLAILGGYWPTACFSFVLLAFAWSSWWGILLGLPQIIPTLWYWPRSIRAGAKFDLNFGKVPLWRYLDLILPNLTQNSINGVLWPEMAMYAGLAPFLALFSKPSGWMIVMVSSLFLKIQRVPARSLYLFSFALVMMSLNAKINLTVLIIQAWLLLQNSDIYPHFPFCQWWKRPSEMFREMRLSASWPWFTGYLQGQHVIKYSGGFCLKEDASEVSWTGFV